MVTMQREDKALSVPPPDSPQEVLVFAPQAAALLSHQWEYSLLLP